MMKNCMKNNNNLSMDNIPIVCTDLDGTLTPCDTLWESLIAMFRKNPVGIALLPYILLRKGKVGIKKYLAESFEPLNLPWRMEVLEFLKEHHRCGDKIWLVTAAHITIANKIAEELNIFERVIATESINCKGGNKLSALVNAVGERGGIEGGTFQGRLPVEYLGDSTVDLAVWKGVETAVVCGNSTILTARASSVCPQVVELRSPHKNMFRIWLKQLRVWQWSKNILLFVPLILDQAFSLSTILTIILGVVAFSFLSSCIYIINDLLDLASDRSHPTKKNRPLAAGAISIPDGFIACFLGIVVLMILFSYFSTLFQWCLVVYFLSNILYSWIIKTQPVIDVVFLAMMYTLRIIAGSAAIGAAQSVWLIGFSFFLFLSLAMAKRYIELDKASSSILNENRRGYKAEDRVVVMGVGIGAGLLSVLVLALYIQAHFIINDSVFRYPKWLLGICPVMTYWVIRFWLLTGRSEVGFDPVEFSIKDKLSWVVAGIAFTFYLLAR